MDYRRHYDLLIDRARNRRLTGYFERHHVVPKCMGGGNEKANIVCLTAEEHFVAHQLLVKMHPESSKLLWAISAMRHATKRHARNNRMYGWLRRRFAEAISKATSGLKRSPEARARMAAAARGRKRKPHTAETRAKMSAAAKGRPKSAAHRAALSAAKQGTVRGPHSEETKQKMSASQRVAVLTRNDSHKHDPAYRARQSENMRRIWAERKAQKEG